MSSGWSAIRKLATNGLRVRLKTVAAGVLVLSVDVDETKGGSKFLVVTIGPLADVCQRPHERPAYWRHRVLDGDGFGIVHRPCD